ncbi:hypothetical protein IscW_ISCW004406 [Ixodes scapularis]|uniref:Uncharacterized protein n=1 Tax=Ixodes scapularis TaxID=6945 RepID=B7PJ69_IXOSC|nr:hypothetical protein IscW_ISCW004406 [Ixodes scapularis]|eukprot:XP_002407247.1 hypothetical protein IscW_ISCW004406 [Ixodes scapularis]
MLYLVRKSIIKTLKATVAHPRRQHKRAASAVAAASAAAAAASTPLQVPCGQHARRWVLQGPPDLRQQSLCAYLATATGWRKASKGTLAQLASALGGPVFLARRFQKVCAKVKSRPKSRERSNRRLKRVYTPRGGSIS